MWHRKEQKRKISKQYNNNKTAKKKENSEFICTISDCLVHSNTSGESKMARTKINVHTASLINAIQTVEGETGCKTLDELYGRVARQYVKNIENLDGFDVLSSQVVKARIGELLEAGTITLKTAPGRRSGGSANGGSQKERILSALVKCDEEIDVILTALTEHESRPVAESLKNRLADIFEIVENLHKRHSSAESESNSEETDEVPPMMDAAA